MNCSWLLKMVAGFVFMFVVERNAHAAFTFTVMEVGPSVDVTGSGTIDLTDVSPGAGGAIGSARIFPSAGLLVGATSAAGTIAFTASGPADWGSGGQSSASSDSGDMVAISGGTIFLPSSYVSGAQLSDSETFLGQSFATLGITPGVYTYTWGNGVHADSLTVLVDVPEPNACLLLIVGGMLLLIHQGRRFRLR